MLNVFTLATIKNSTFKIGDSWDSVSLILFGYCVFYLRLIFNCSQNIETAVKLN